jgi:uncharacterized repeat protein (TIGR01451 family)
MYPMTVWYTAYDWFQPLTAIEENRLATYLNGGGRLLFSSQDYIYNLPEHEPGPFAQNYLGVLDHLEDYSSTVVIGQTGSPVGAGLGPYPLTFPPGYTNWTDALTPTAAARTASVGQFGQPNGLTLMGSGTGGQTWHTNFFSFGPELLAPADRVRLLQRSVGWLSWLGSSTLSSSLSASLDGSDLTFTATLINDGWINLPTAAFTATFPSELTPGPALPPLTLSGGNLVWSGPLGKNEQKVFTYTAQLANSLPLGTTVKQVSWLAYPEHNILFDRIAQIRVNFPELANSTMTVTPAQGVQEGDLLTYTIVLKNDGLVDDPLVTTTNTLPHMLELVGLDPPSQGALITGGQSFTWTTPLAKNEVATLTYRAVISYETSSAIENSAVVDDDLNDPLTLVARSNFKSRTIYLPIISKE